MNRFSGQRGYVPPVVSRSRVPPASFSIPWYNASRMLVEPNYRGFRIEVTAQHVDGAWDVEVRVRRIVSEMKPNVEVVMCRKPTAKVAEQRGLI